MHNLNKNLGLPITTTQLKNSSFTAFNKLADRTFITFFHDTGWQSVWFPVMLNNKNMKFDSELSMEICREKFGHTSFGISNGEQASLGNACIDNL